MTTNLVVYKNRHVFSPSSGGQKTEIKGSVGPGSREGTSLHCPASGGSRLSLWLSSSHLHLYLHELSVSSLLSLVRTLVIRIGTTWRTQD